MLRIISPKNSLFCIILVAQIITFYCLDANLNIKFAKAKEPEAPEQSEAEKGKGEGEGSKETGDGFLKKDEFLELNASIEQLNSKIKSKGESLKKLLVDKEHITDPIEFKKVVKQIEDEYRETTEMIESVEKKRAILKHRFPERSFVKNSETSKVLRLDELKGEALIEKKVNLVLGFIEKQYNYTIRPKEIVENDKARKPASDSEEQNVLKQNPEDFSKSLILKK